VDLGKDPQRFKKGSPMIPNPLTPSSNKEAGR
jgi:hypothetical protein